MGSEAIKGRAQQQQADNLHRQASQQNASHAVAGNQLRRVQRGDEVGHAERDKAIPGLPRRHSQTGLHGQRHTEHKSGPGAEKEQGDGHAKANAGELQQARRQ